MLGPAFPPLALAPTAPLTVPKALPRKPNVPKIIAGEPQIEDVPESATLF